MSRLWRLLFDNVGSFPRVSGDEPIVSALQDGEVWFSPRERG